MNTSVLNEVLDNILTLNLTTEERQWIASRLCADVPQGKPLNYKMEEGNTDMVGEETFLQPYTMAEINSRLDEAERELEEGGGIDNEDVFREAWERMYKVQYA